MNVTGTMRIQLRVLVQNKLVFETWHESLVRKYDSFVFVFGNRIAALGVHLRCCAADTCCTAGPRSAQS